MSIVEEYLVLKEQRLDFERQADKLKKTEQELKEQIITALRAGDIKTLGKYASNLTLSTKQKPVVDNWQAVWEWILKTKSFDIVQRRLTESAVMERWQDNVSIPGVNKFPVFDFTFRALK